jgi:predicted 3-demethylubiquinone-9 3-methyltransferase (glyoxalase superfamily)
MEPITPTLWINGEDMDEAAAFYCSLFGDGRVTGSNDYGPDAGEWAGKAMVKRLELNGQPFVLLNGGTTTFTPNESVSFVLTCADQSEVDRLWKVLADGGQPGPCGWIKDRYGFSWQVVPKALFEMLDDPDGEKVQRVTACFMQVDGRAFDVAELQAAYDGR